MWETPFKSQTIPWEALGSLGKPLTIQYLDPTSKQGSCEVQEPEGIDLSCSCPASIYSMWHELCKTQSKGTWVKFLIQAPKSGWNITRNLQDFQEKGEAQPIFLYNSHFAPCFSYFLWPHSPCHAMPSLFPSRSLVFPLVAAVSSAQVWSWLF